VYGVEAPYVDGRSPWLPLAPPFRIFERTAPKQYRLTVDRHLNEGDVLPYAGGLRVIHAPGHTPGHIVLHAERRGVLFAGDALMNILGPRLPLAAASHDMTAARASVHRLAELEFDIALPGHGTPIVGRASEKVREWARTWL
jgi:glyoxylase-like metal-dependent hydrolase (beta-lactamase superfamily II)